MRTLLYVAGLASAFQLLALPLGYGWGWPPALVLGGYVGFVASRIPARPSRRRSFYRWIIPLIRYRDGGGGYYDWTYENYRLDPKERENDDDINC